MLGALGLAACSLITLKGATRTLDPGHPLYFVERQGIYFGIGLAAALLLARLDYSRLREYKYGLYGVMIALNLIVLGMPKVQGAARWIPLPFFQLQPSEFGKILLIVAVSAFAVDRSRRLHEWRTTSRIILLAILPAVMVIPQPDLGTALVYVVAGFAILFFAGTSWKQLTVLVVLGRGGNLDGAGRPAGDRLPPAEALPDAAADWLPASVARRLRTRPTTSFSR